MGVTNLRTKPMKLYYELIIPPKGDGSDEAIKRL